MPFQRNPNLPDDPKLRIKVIRANWRARLKADPIRLAKYNDRMRRYGKAYLERAKQDPEKWKSITVSKRAYMERMKADPERLERYQEQQRESHRRLYHAKPKPEPKKRILTPKEPTPKPVAMHPINVREFKKPLLKRGRPRKPKKSDKRTVMITCLHREGFTFTKLEVGLKRTCKACGKSFTEIPKPC